MSVIGFIGGGNMGGALIRGVCQGTDPAGVLVYDHNQDKMDALASQTGCTAAESAAQVAAESGILMLCVKPKVLAKTIDEIRPALGAGLTVSIAAGVTLDDLRGLLGDRPTARVMPNTPSAIGKGVLLAAYGPTAEQTCRERLAALLAPCGSVEQVTEQELDEGTALTGCGPAFAYLFLEALADGGVQIGLPRDKAQRYAAQTLLGAAAMVLETGEHPGALKDAVCSPGGSTIVGVAELENRAFRAAAAQAVVAAYGRFRR